MKIFKIAFVAAFAAIIATSTTAQQSGLPSVLSGSAVAPLPTAGAQLGAATAAVLGGSTTSTTTTSTN